MGSADVEREMAAFEAKKQAAKQAREGYAASWRRLRALRDGLAREIDSRLADKLRVTDEDALYEDMRAAWRVRVGKAAAEAGEAAALLSAWDAAAGVVGKVLRRAERGRLAAEAEERRREAEAMERETIHKESEFRSRAKTLARDNRRANEAAGRPLAPLKERLAGLGHAMDAIEAGDQSVIACLMRWDVDALVRIGHIWRRIKDYDGRVGESDWDYYCSAGRPRTPPPYGAPAWAQGADGGPEAPPAAGDEGRVVRVAVAPDGTVTGATKADYRGTAAGTSLSAIGIVGLAEMLGGLRLDGYELDAELLEAFLDAADANWREQVAAAMNGEAQPGGGRDARPAPAEAAEDPYDVLGVTRDTPTPEIAEAFRAVMQAVQHLPNAAPQRRFIAAFKAIKAERAHAPSSDPAA
jgi:hypothetical protein